MIGRSEWFQRRKYGGWGLTPKTWQGWLYIGVMSVITFGLMNAPLIPEVARMPLAYGWIALFCFDVLHMMATLKKDEMEVKIEALAERNASWAMIAVMAAAIGYQTAKTALSGTPQIDWWLIVTLVAGVVAKALTNVWLERKGV